MTATILSEIPKDVTTGRAWLTKKFRGEYKYLAVTHRGNLCIGTHVEHRTDDGVAIGNAKWVSTTSRTCTDVEQDHEYEDVAWLSRERTSLYRIEPDFDRRAVCSTDL